MARASATRATLLPNGEVLVAGGYPGEGAPPTDSLEVFDPRTGTFRVVGRLNEARADHSTSLLPDGRVLVAGGTDAGGQALRSTEVVDPSTGAVSQGSTLPRPRSAHVVTDLGGDPLVVGGSADGIRAVRATFRYDVAAERWRSGPDLKRPRVKCAAVTLPDGTVLVLGGSGDVEGRARYRSTEILRPGVTGSCRAHTGGAEIQDRGRGRPPAGRASRGGGWDAPGGA